MRESDFMDSLARFDAGVKPLEQGDRFSKDDLLAAEVSLPLAPNCDVASLRVVQVRPPYCRESRPLLVDASRLPAP